jgi:branched-chain amino acid transport system permease protein
MKIETAFMQVFFNGMVDGLVLAALTVAWSVVYLPARVFHVALAGIYTAAPFIMWSCLQKGIAPPLAITITVMCAVLLSLICEFANHWRLERKGTGPAAHLIASLGLYIILVQAVALIWGTETKVLHTGLDRVVNIGSVVVTQAQIISAGASSALLLLFALWLRGTGTGLRFRALADNPREFAVRGFNVRAMRLLAFGLAGLFAAVCALVAANDDGFDPNGGLSALLLAVVAGIIGGRLSFFGAALGGLLLGVTRAEIAWFLSARWQEAFTFLLLALFLFVRPDGLINRTHRVEVAG